MTKERFLTVRWNNVLALALGIPSLIYIILALTSSAWSVRGGMIGLSIIGVLYWLIVEGHTYMRFAWLRENSDNPVSLKNAFDSRLIRMAFWAFNAVFWIFLLPS